jgi:hypothetical protein
MGVRRAFVLAASVAAATLGLVAPALVVPASPVPAAAATACRVTDATLTWGFKASFRAYITSSITHGTWTTSGNAGYTTPNFIWRAGTGTFDPAATSGEVAFTGSVHFTGHEGMLDSTFSNPRLRFTNASTAVLVVDYTGVSMTEALAGSTTPTSYPGVSFVALALASGSRGGSGATTTFTSVPTSITAAGYAAFGSHEAGTAFDPLTISITRDASCGAPASSKPATTTGGASTNGKGAAGSAPTSKAPGIVAASGLPLPSTASTAPDGSTAAAGEHDTASPSPSASPMRTLEVLASAGSTDRSLGDGLLLGLAGLVVGVGMTLLIQFAHVRLLARRKAVRAE